GSPQARSATRGGRRSKPSSSRRTGRTSTSWPSTTTPTTSRRRSTSTTRRWRATGSTGPAHAPAFEACTRRRPGAITPVGRAKLDEPEPEAFPAGLVSRCGRGDGRPRAPSAPLRRPQARAADRAPPVLRLPGDRPRAPAAGGPLHRGGEPRELPGRRRAGRGPAPPDPVPGDAARLPRDSAASLLPRPRGLHPDQPGRPRSGRDPPRPPGPGCGRGGRHLPGGAVQPPRGAGARAARGRAGRAPGRRPGRPGGDLGDVPRAGGPALLRAAARAAGGALRQSAPVRPGGPTPRDAGRAGRRHPADHGRDRRAPRQRPEPCARGRGPMTEGSPPLPPRDRFTAGGRFAEAAAPTARAFTASLPFDHRLWRYDLQGSEAWARALARGGVLAAAELETILRGLGEIRGELEAGTFPYRLELEDIHMNIERRLIEKVGAVGGKLHTGRSRNDQIAVDMRLWLRAEIDGLRTALRDVQAALL